jgi:hypothetical protein
MKGIWFTFDAFGQWSEHDRSKMKWRMKVGVELSPSWQVSQRLVAGRPPSPSFLPLPSTIYLFSSTTTPLGQSRGRMATWACRLATILGQLAISWLPYKRVAKWSLLLHPISSQATSNFAESFSKFLACLG